jgi:hypothetical protein
VAWRLAARSDELSVKLFEAYARGEVILEWNARCGAADGRAEAVTPLPLGADGRGRAGSLRAAACPRRRSISDSAPSTGSAASTRSPFTEDRDGGARRTHQFATAAGDSLPGRATIRRLAGPKAQVSSAARERRDTMVLLLAVAFVALPQFEHLPWWAIGVIALLWSWRAWITLRNLPLPGHVAMLPLLARPPAPSGFSTGRCSAARRVSPSCCCCWR